MRKPRIDEQMDNRTVAEVRKWRAQMVRDAGGTLEGLVRQLRQSAAEDRKSQRARARPARATPRRRKSA